MSDEGDGFIESIDAALGDDDYLPTKWAMVVEHINQEGERVIDVIHSGDLRTWDLLGLFEFGRTAVSSHVMADEIEYRGGS